MKLLLDFCLYTVAASIFFTPFKTAFITIIYLAMTGEALKLAELCHRAGQC